MRRPSWPFWFLVGAMALALAGGATIVLLVRQTAAGRRASFRASEPPPAGPAGPP
ncbi:MAG TPA: hypothetical protein VML50_10495 [Anaeromyxobacter sp.]|nr:hypothetical protein [Anaeromyxobacter sp.]